MIAEKPSILIVVNPISGGKSKKRFIFIARNYFKEYFDVQWLFWKKPDQKIPEEIRSEISKRKYYCVVAAGGDGTVNQTARGLTGTDVPMGIIPLGSGNGLARHLGYRIKIKEAMEIIHRGKTLTMDAAHVNNEMFFCSSGTGFDAHIGHVFAGLGKRGPARYVQSIVMELHKYVPKEYKITIDGKAHFCKAFLITVANAGQYGNNAWIAPKASLQDGLLDVIIIHPFSVINAPDLAVKLFRKRIDKNHKVESFRAKEIFIEETGSINPLPVHFDGEPAMMQGPLKFTIDHAAVKVMVP